jgi:hypothetical protein
MSNEIVKTESKAALATVGGVGLGSRHAQIKPDYIVVVQPTSTEGKPGTFRFASTGDEFQEIQLVHLTDSDRRKYYEGQDFKSGNLICWSLDGLVPDSRAKIPQSMDCASCSRSSWEKYRQTGNKLDLPPCKEILHNLVIERSSGLPFYFDVKGRSIKGYEEALQSIARQCVLLQARGGTPNIYEFSFVLTLEKVGAYYVVKMKGKPGLIAKEDREKFSALYEKYVQQAEQAKQASEVAVQDAQAVRSVEEELTDGEYI